MGLKWFRAHLSLTKLKKEASRVPGMIGLYRRTSHFESNVKNEVLAKNEVSSPSITSDSTAFANKEEAQHKRSKADLASQLSSSIDSQKHDNYKNVNTDPSTSKDSDLKEQALPQDEKLNNNRERSNSLNVKSRSDNKLIDSNLKEQYLSQDEESNKKNKEQSDSSDNELVDSKEQYSSQEELNNMNTERSNNSDTNNRLESEWLVI
ncbi:protein starmaker-like [Camponotus floridanus]|uniref:protein starmaker-like n=1 Tax=Camponotus floridanus TaxID=104421 RepID=UPI00059CFCC8|nr:protein starmaker-like [Camponotus floridanus]XP_025266938.1 protein starmaker-like [Camponotus floridanus]